MMHGTPHGEYLSGCYKLQGQLFSMLQICELTNDGRRQCETQMLLDHVNNIIADMKPEYPRGRGVCDSHTRHAQHEGIHL